LRAERARLQATDERVPRALSGSQPTAGLTGSVGQDLTDSRLGSFGRGAQRTVETRPTRFRFEIRQTMFRGPRTGSGTREAEKLVRAACAQLQETERSVLFQAVTAHMDVVRDQAVVELNVNNERVLARLAATSSGVIHTTLSPCGSRTRAMACFCSPTATLVPVLASKPRR
jgi:outer membrane protein TolC